MLSGITYDTVLWNLLVFIQEIDNVHAFSCDNEDFPLSLDEIMIDKSVKNIIVTVSAELYTSLDFVSGLPFAYCQQHVNCLLVA